MYPTKGLLSDYNWKKGEEGVIGVTPKSSTG